MSEFSHDISGEKNTKILIIYQNCCFRKNEELIQFHQSFQNIMDNYNIAKFHIIPIKNRFIFCYKKLHRKVITYKFLYYLGHSIVTIGSLIVPALLSIQYNTGDVTNSGHGYISGIYWSTWILSLLVTIFNGVLTLFKIDRNYYLYNIYLEKLKSETYQYFSLSGRYTGHHTGDNYRQRTYTDQLIVYSYVLEKIYMKLVENEFAQIEDGAQEKNSPQKKEAAQSQKQIGLSPTNPLEFRQSPFESLANNNDRSKDSNDTDSTTSGHKNEVVQPDLENQIKQVVQKFFIKGIDQDEEKDLEDTDESKPKLPYTDVSQQKTRQKKPWK